MSAQTRTRRGWVVPAAVASAAVVASLAMGTLGAYSASIRGEDNLAGTGNLAMSEALLDDAGQLVGDVFTTEGSPDNTIDSDINRYGGAAQDGASLRMVPGDEIMTSVRLTNQGDVPGALTLAFAEVTAGVDGEAGALADTLLLTVATGSGDEVQPVGAGAQSLNAWAAQGSALSDMTIGAGESQDFTFTISLPEDVDNNLMGLTVQQPMTWTLTAGAEAESPDA